MARPLATQEERDHRSKQLLDAALALWQEHPDRIASVAEVAQRAGVAKGTVYLYFRSKEDLLLAAHERHVAGFFSALVARAASPERMVFDDMMLLTRQHFVEPPVVLPLATLVAGVRHKGVTPEALEAFETRVAEGLRVTGAMLLRHFALPDELAGVRLLMRSYALILGLWQLVGSEQPICRSPEVAAMLLPDYPSELDAALRALWLGTLE